MIYHLALADEWQLAVDNGSPYRRSTLGRSLEEEGFIHCSFPGQVQTIADLFYRDRDDVVLLAIDERALDAEVRVENLEGGGEQFPHVYGPIPVDAVAWTEALQAGSDGRLQIRAEL